MGWQDTEELYKNNGLEGMTICQNRAAWPKGWPASVVSKAA